MSNCKYCHIKFTDSQGVCPLCGKRTGEAEQSPYEYPHYGNNIAKDDKSLFLKIFMLITVSVCFITAFINIFTFNSESQSMAIKAWSLIASSAVISCWLFMETLLSKRLVIGAKLLYFFAISCLLLFIIDLLTGFRKWSTNYFIPFATIALTASYTILAVRKRKKFKEYSGYLITTFFISVIPVLLLLFSLSTLIWSSLIAILYSFLTFAALIIFADRALKNEIKKRFNF